MTNKVNSILFPFFNRRTAFSLWLRRTVALTNTRRLRWLLCVGFWRRVCVNALFHAFFFFIFFVVVKTTFFIFLIVIHFKMIACYPLSILPILALFVKYHPKYNQILAESSIIMTRNIVIPVSFLRISY